MKSCHRDRNAEVVHQPRAQVIHLGHSRHILGLQAGLQLVQQVVTRIQEEVFRHAPGLALWNEDENKKDHEGGRKETECNKVADRFPPTLARKKGVRA